MTRVAVFGALLAAAFAGAFGIGALVRGGDEPQDGVAEGADPSAHGGHAEEAADAAPAAVVGLAVADGGVRLVAETTTFVPRKTTSWAFRILGDDGEAVTRYDVEHERPMHLIVVRRDLTGFQHLHPELSGDGTWSVDLRLPAGGTYRAFADFVADGEKRTLGIDLFAGRDESPLPLPSADVRLDKTVYETGARELLRFDADGRVERYLGAAGHLVILREGDLGYLHTHAEDDVLEFETTFPSPGRYRAFLQFKRDGAVATAAFDLGAR